MPPAVTSDGAALTLIVSLVGGLAFLGLYVWYGWALSRLFPRLGAEGWKGWVPVLNEVVILERGGAPVWAVVLYFLPIVNLHALYLKWVAMVRLGEQFGRGRGLAVVGILVPPVWATILASADVPDEDRYGERVRGMMTASGPPPPPLAAGPEPEPVSEGHPEILDARDEEFERTVIFDRRPVVRWSLLTETGVALRLTSGSVVLGRRPTPGESGVELMTVPDETRTMSKSHARLDLRNDVWTVTDLHSTNGVILVAADGSETQLPAGGSAPLSGHFILGTVSLRLVFENGPL